MKVVVVKNDLIVINLETNDDSATKEHSDTTSYGDTLYHPQILRVYKDHLELDVSAFNQQSGEGKKQTLKEWFHDFIVMNRTLFRISHPQSEYNAAAK